MPAGNGWLHDSVVASILEKIVYQTLNLEAIRLLMVELEVATLDLYYPQLSIVDQDESCSITEGFYWYLPVIRAAVMLCKMITRHF